MINHYSKRFKTLDGKAPMVIGHRGSPGFGGENTLLGYRRAIMALEADGFEIDIRLTKDKELVACHDLALNRLIGEQQLNDLFPEYVKEEENGSVWYTADFTLAELQQLKVTYPAPGCERLDYNKLGEEYRMPSYGEILDLFLSLKEYPGKEDIILYTELVSHPEEKDFPGHVLMGYKLLEAFSKIGFENVCNSVWLQSFDYRLMEYLSEQRELLGFQKTQLSLYRDSNEIDAIRNEADFRNFVLEKVAKNRLDVFHIWKVAMLHLVEDLQIDVVGIVHRLGLKLHLFTFDDTKFYSDYTKKYDQEGFKSISEEFHYFYALGVDAVMSDFISSAKEVRDAMQLINVKQESLLKEFAIN